MVWRLPHPVRGIIAFALVWAGGATLLGFGAGVPELAGLFLVAASALAIANRWPGSKHDPTS